MGAREFYFAWVAEAEAFDPVAHKRKDLHLKSVSVREEETVAGHSMTLGTEAMAVADLAGRWWGLLSYETPDGRLWPLARGKRRPISAVTAFGEQTLDFTCLPSDWQARQNAGLQPLAVLPYFDPLLVAADRQSDPTEILDGHRAVGRFDRVTGAYSIVELLGLGLPVKVLDPSRLVGWKDGGGVKRRETQQPLAGVQCEVTFEWTQAINGPVDLGPALAAAFPAANVGDRGGLGPGTTVTPKGKKQALSGVLPEGIVATLTGDALENSFPQQGTGIGGASGYTAIIARCVKFVPPVSAGGAAAPVITGAVRGQKAKYDYSTDADLTKPLGLNLDIEYYDAELVLGFELRQKRRERIIFYIGNAGVSPTDGKTETVTAKGQDPTAVTDALPYLPNEHVSVGDVRRNGWYLWQVLVEHVTKGRFEEDLEDAQGHPRWKLLPGNGSAAGAISIPSFVTTARGQKAIVCTALKAMKKLALSKRNVQFDLTVPLDLWPDVSTAFAVELHGDPKVVPGGVATGKVIDLTIGKDSPKDFAKVTLSIACCRGTGAVTPGPAAGINPSGESWDGITLASSLTLAYPATPVPGANLVAVNGASDQVAYIMANDFNGTPGRNDKLANDPKHLLTQAKTKLVIDCTPISGQPALTLDASLPASAYAGPAQVSVPTV